MPDEMQWSKLLEKKRVRDFFGGRATQKLQSELRDEIERDYGRWLFSTPVRRLRDKTQVFPLERHDSVRTRLAHSLEVSSVARTLAAHAAMGIGETGGLNPSDQINVAWIAATCGLIHDLGNPPFGHAGELAIQSWFKEQLGSDPAFFDDMSGEASQYAQDFLGFEGNAQTLRLVSHLQLLSDHFGLNLTAATVSASSKYLAPSHMATHGGHAFSKPGFFASEQDVVSVIRDATGTLGRRHPVTHLVEAADDIVYLTVDLEDGVKKKIITWEEVQTLLTKSELGQELVTEAWKRIKEEPPPPAVRGETLAQVFRTIAITRFASIALDVFKHRYTLIMDGSYQDELLVDPESEARDLVNIIKKQVLKPLLYTTPEILKLEVRGRQVIQDLMTIFWDAAYKATGTLETTSYHGKLYLLISENYRRVFERKLHDPNREEPEKYIRLQLVTDHIAGMTDTHACQLHKELTNGA